MTIWTPLEVHRYGCMVVAGALFAGCTASPGDSANRNLTCNVDADCRLGERCTASACVIFDDPDIEYWAARDGVIGSVPDGGGMPVFFGFQGGTYTLMTLRTRGFPKSEVVTFEVSVTIVPTGDILNALPHSNIFVASVEGDIGEAEDVFVALDFGTMDTAEIVGREAILTVTLTSSSNASITASLEQRVRFTDGGAG